MANSALKTRRGRPANRRHPLATVALMMIGLVATGGAYALFTTAASAQTPTAASQSSVQEGQKIFAANCATCHGMNAQGTKDGPSLYGVGAASVSFQVGTGRMPLAQQGPQAEQKPPQFTDEQVADLAAYVASLAPGPGIPDSKYLQADGNAATGAQLFRINCAMCHNVAGAGGALTDGKFAPALAGVSAEHVYEAMVTGPQNMPVFNDANLTPTQKADIITYLKYLEKNPSPGGFDLGSLGPVSEGLFIWIFGLGAVVGVTIWIAAKAN
ncbi:cytochrome bc1 complex diheme cytochrome c subunit [Parafrigoribacterium soli]|uniref:cytochrome bc1 complex diheme cytochrome c subunit n=1 Tax=Parafrigoribacterium soli TaxID=3144663 RepID=UPI0032EFBE86